MAGEAIANEYRANAFLEEFEVLPRGVQLRGIQGGEERKKNESVHATRRMEQTWSNYWLGTRSVLFYMQLRNPPDELGCGDAP